MIKKLIQALFGSKNDLVIPDHYVKVEEQPIEQVEEQVVEDVTRDSNAFTVKAKFEAIEEPVEKEEEIIIDEAVSESKKPKIEFKSDSTPVIVDNRKEYNIKAEPPKPIAKKVPDVIMSVNVSPKDFAKINNERLAKIDKLTTIIKYKKKQRYLDLMTHK